MAKKPKAVAKPKAVVTSTIRYIDSKNVFAREKNGWKKTGNTYKSLIEMEHIA